MRHSNIGRKLLISVCPQHQSFSYDGFELGEGSEFFELFVDVIVKCSWVVRQMGSFQSRRATGVFTRNLFRFSPMLAEHAIHRPSLDVSEIAVTALVETSAFLIRHGAGFLVESHLKLRRLHSQQDQLNE